MFPLCGFEMFVLFHLMLIYFICLITTNDALLLYKEHSHERSFDFKFLNFSDQSYTAKIMKPEKQYRIQNIVPLCFRTS